MFEILKLITSPLLGMFLLTLGGGLMSTFVVLRLQINNEASILVGLITSIYYAGLMAGSWRAEKFIMRVGYIRAFATFASFLLITYLMQSIQFSVVGWLVLRFIGGFCTAGLFIVIESWLMVLGDTKLRGRMMAMYMVSLYLGQSMGQLLINVGKLESNILFQIASILTGLSVIVLAMTKVVQPEVSEPSDLDLKHLFCKSPSGVWSCVTSGLILGAVYGLLPVFFIAKLDDTAGTSILMAVTIFGGMALQYPLGRLSDRVERLKVLIGILIAIILLSFITMFFIGSTWLYVLLFFIFGGLTFALYPISINVVCDNLVARDIVAGVQGLSLFYSVGATLGPIFASLFIDIIPKEGLMIYFILVSGLLLWFLFVTRKKIGKISPNDELNNKRLMLTPNTVGIDQKLKNRHNSEL